MGPLKRKGKIYRRAYSFTQANSDGGGTIGTGIINGIKAIQATSNVVDKDSSASFDVATGIITVVNNGTAGPTIGWVDVLYLLK